MLTIEIALVAVGLAVILMSGDLLVRGAVAAARGLKIPALIVSLTIVAFGTSAPEMFVAAEAVLLGNPGIAVGAIVGSNIANLLLVLGLPALVHPIATRSAGLRKHAVALLVATAVIAAIAYLRGGLDRMTGAVLFAGIIAYVGYMWLRIARGARDDPVVDEVEEYAGDGRLGARTLMFIGAGLLGLPLGANLLIEHGAKAAAELGVRDELIGLTLVAVGTSLPELATVLVAALRRKCDVVLGSVVGSNIFNIFAVGGVAGLVGGARFDAETLAFEIPAMLAATLAVAAFIYARRDIGRLAGALLLLAYGAFIAILAMNAAA
jgi:cation:H+ antiporter